MGRSDSNHELTRVALREEVEKSFNEVLPNTVPDEAKRSLSSKVEQIVERYSSPYPDPVFLKKIDELIPGYAQQVMDASLAHLSHRQEMEKGEQELQGKQIDLVRQITENEIRSTGQGRLLGFSAYISCLAFAGGAAYLQYDLLAIAGFLTAAAGVVVQIVRGTKSAVSVNAGVDVGGRTPSTTTPSRSSTKKPRRR